jgi:hypothetical protein
MIPASGIGIALDGVRCGRGRLCGPWLRLVAYTRLLARHRPHAIAEGRFRLARQPRSLMGSALYATHVNVPVARLRREDHAEVIHAPHTARLHLPERSLWLGRVAMPSGAKRQSSTGQGYFSAMAVRGWVDDTKGNGSSWIFGPCLTCANALLRVQHPAFFLVTLHPDGTLKSGPSAPPNLGCCGTRPGRTATSRFGYSFAMTRR